MQTANYFAAVILLTLSPAALANSIQFTVNSSVPVTGDSPNDSYWGYYTTLPDAVGTTPSVNAGIQSFIADTTFPTSRSPCLLEA